MIQSRFFHSSLNEIELNIKEIYSLQSKLRDRVLVNTNKPAKIIPVQSTSSLGLEIPELSSAYSEHLVQNDVSDFMNVEITRHSAELPKQQSFRIEEKFDKNNIHQTNTSNFKSGSKFKFELNEINKWIKSAEETLKEHLKINFTLAVVLIFLILIVTALMIYVLFILIVNP